MQPHITESVERMEMQRLGDSPAVSGQLPIHPGDKGSLEMKVQTHCHPVTAGGSCQTTPKCCIAPY